jgi:hypothetical protein
MIRMSLTLFLVCSNVLKRKIYGFCARIVITVRVFVSNFSWLVKLVRLVSQPPPLRYPEGTESLIERRLDMKRTVLAFVLGVILAGCASGPGHMVKQEKLLDVRTVKPQPGKAAVLVTRNTNFGGAVEFPTYLEQKMFGVSRFKSCFYKDDVEPGQHYISSYGENLDTLLMDLAPDTTYYLTHDPRMGFWKAAVSTGVTTLDVVAKENEEGCNFYVYDTKNPGEDLTADDWTYAKTHFRKP